MERTGSRRGPSISDIGIVLRSHGLGESDKILRMMTRGSGKRSAVAKGIRKTTSRIGARLEPLTCARLLLHVGRNMDTVRQVEIQTSFKEVREDLDLYLHGSAMAELVDGMTAEHEPHPELFDLLLEGLTLLKDRPASAPLTLLAFELKAMATAGFELQLGACSACGRALEGEACVLSPQLGGLVCEKCRSGGRGVGKTIAVGPPAASLLRWLGEHGLGEEPAAPPAEGDTLQLRLMMDKVLEHWMEKEFKSHRVMKTIPARLAGRNGG